MFSTMMTEESTMMPKSTAPMESRFADLPRKYSMEKANSKASGILMATMMAVRMLLTNMNRIDDDEQHADHQVFRHRLGGDVEQVRAVVIRLDLHAGQLPPGRGVVELLDFLLDVFQGGQGILVLAHQHDALDHVVLVMADVGESCGRSRRPLAVGLPITDSPEARLVADDDALLPELARGNPAALDHVLDADRLVVDRGDHQAADVADAAIFLRAEDGGSAKGRSLIDGLDVTPFFLGQRRVRLSARANPCQNPMPLLGE